MQLKNKKKSKKSLYITIALVVLLAIILYVVYLLFISPKKELSTINYNQPTSDQKKAGSRIKSSAVDPTTKNTKTSGSDQPPSPTSIPGTSQNRVQIAITAVNQTSTTLQIRTMIDSVVGDGTCTLTLQSSTQTITKSADVQPLASTSTCKGFDVPLSEVSQGVWHLTVSYQSSSLTGIAEKDITIK